MTGGLVEGAVLGAVFQEGAKPITSQISKGFKFRKTRKKLASLVHRMMPAAKQIKLLDEKLDRPKEETEMLIEELEQAKETVNKYTKVPWWKCCCLPCYQGKLHAMDEQIGSSSIVTLMNTARDGKETLSIVRGISQGKQFNRLCDAPVKPGITVGLDFPLNRLKNWILNRALSVHVLTGLAGSGKTTLAALLCWDDQVRAQGCWGSPLALKLIGGSLRGQHIEAWKKMVNLLSRGRSIVASNNDLLNHLQNVLEDALDDKPIIKECFMDLGLFFQDKEIPVAALIDIWTELNNLDDDNIEGMNFVHELDNLHLVNLVASREAASYIDNYYNHHFVTQHDLLKEIAIHQARQEPYEKRTRLIFDVNENSWDQQNQQNTVARTLSMSTDKMSPLDWSNVVKAEKVEVLILNLHTDKFIFPECIKKMTSLKVLIIINYNGFHFAELENFEILGFLPKLRRIRLQQVSVPSLCKLTNLQKLSLYNCKTRPDFQSDTISISELLPKLEELSVDYCKYLKSLPAGLCDITSLKKLSITRCIHFLALPQEIGNLENLKVLRLGSCAELEQIPTSVGKLVELHFLDISGCPSLRTLPEEIGNLHNLKELHMTGDSSDTLPESVTELKNLKHLICDQETAVCWEHYKPSLPNLKIEEAEIKLFITV